MTLQWTRKATRSRGVRGEVVFAASRTLLGFLLLCATSFGLLSTAHAQGTRKDDIVFNAQGRPMAGATVRVCTSGATGQPCSPLALTYSDAALTQALANPMSTDGLGNYTFYAAPGRYMLEINGPGITTKQLPNVILPSDPSSPTFTSVTTTSGISAFSLGLTGNLTVNGSASVAGPVTASGSIFNVAGQFTNISNSCALQGQVNGGSIGLFSSSGSGSYTMDGVCGAVIIPNTATVSQSDGATGIVENHSSSVYSMGGYFQTHQYAANKPTWGINTVGWLFGGANNDTLQNECDFDVDTGVSGALVYCWALNAPYWNSAPAHSAGIALGKPGGTSGAQWTNFLESADGATGVGLNLGTNATGNGHGSQAIQLSSVDSGGTRRTGGFSTDANGSLYLNPGSGASVVSQGPLVENGAITASGAIKGPSYTTTNLLISSTAPTISAGFNTSGNSISANNGTAAFIIAVGTGTATSTGTIALPAATTGWNCFATNRTRADYIQETSTTTTTAVLTNYGTTFAATNFTNSDVLQVSCFAY